MKNDSSLYSFVISKHDLSTDLIDLLLNKYIDEREYLKRQTFIVT